MKKSIISISAIVLIAIVTIASSNSTYIYNRIGNILSFNDSDIDSITFSKIDANGVKYDNYVTQIIHAKDSSYHASIASLDSITFITPETQTGENGIAISQEVDLGLSVNWAGWNIGATSPEEIGGRYCWGETETKEKYTIENYKFYNPDSIFTDLGYNISGTQYDAARKNWGGSWRIPTRLELQELVEKCAWEWTSFNNVSGYKVIGPNGNSIFIPAMFIGETEIYDEEKQEYITVIDSCLELQSGTCCIIGDASVSEPYKNSRSYCLEASKHRFIEVGKWTKAYPLHLRPVKGDGPIEDASEEAKTILTKATFFAQQIVYDYAEYNIYLSQCLTTTTGAETGSFPYKQGWEFLGINRHPQWRRHYLDLGAQVHDLIWISKETKSPNYELIGRTIRLLSTQLTTDEFGDMISNDRFKTESDFMWDFSTGMTMRGHKAKFETQEDTYKWLLSEADSLIKMFEDPTIINSQYMNKISAEHDRIYGGNLNNWKGLVYAIKARLLLRNIPNINTSAAMCNDIINTAQKAIDCWHSSDNIYGEWFGSEPRFNFITGEYQTLYRTIDASPWSYAQPMINSWESRENRLSNDAVPSKFFMEACLGINFPGVEGDQGTFNARKCNGYGNDPRIMLLMRPQAGPVSESDSYRVQIAYRYLENNVGSGATYKRAHYPDLYYGAYAGALDAYNAIFTMEELYFIQAEAYYWLGNKAKACALAKQATELNIQRHLDAYLKNSGGIYPDQAFAPEKIEDEYTANMWKARFEAWKGAFLNNEKTTVEYSGIKYNGKEGSGTAIGYACSTVGNERWFFNDAEFNLSDLMMQKYIAMYMLPEQWTDLRRYHYSNNLNNIGIGDANEIIYPGLRRPHNLYSAYWVDGLTEDELEKTWLQRLNYDPQVEEIYNSEELIRIGAYKDYKWLQKPMIWAEEPGSRTSLTN